MKGLLIAALFGAGLTLLLSAGPGHEIHLSSSPVVGKGTLTVLTAVDAGP